MIRERLGDLFCFTEEIIIEIVQMLIKILSEGIISSVTENVISETKIGLFISYFGIVNNSLVVRDVSIDRGSLEDPQVKLSPLCALIDHN